MRFEFHGGFMDGQVFVGNASIKDDNTPLLWRYYYLTEGGHIGTRFDEMRQASSEVDNIAQAAIKEALDANDHRTASKLMKKYAVGRLGQTYEVTQREERPDEILIRLDIVDDDTPPAADKPGR
jgi:hypothetical protein